MSIDAIGVIIENAIIENIPYGSLGETQNRASVTSTPNVCDISGLGCKSWEEME